MSTADTMKANTALILAGLALLGISSDYRYLRLVGQSAHWRSLEAC
jgi:hypothetical protein